MGCACDGHGGSGAFLEDETSTDVYQSLREDN